MLNAGVMSGCTTIDGPCAMNGGGRARIEDRRGLCVLLLIDSKGSYDLKLL